ncbi:large ribosomal subunit protein mL53-like [Lineus longissimus]|uniref:large ribosomal subunit protein mL53-like n=1 Tax=Lineus longissimus TaxID=88925 RepID=UPI00315CDBBD
MAASTSLRVPVQILYRQMKNFHLRGVNKVKLSFDPFHESVNSVRQMVFLMSADRVQMSNDNCKIKTEILSNMSEPQIDVDFTDGRKAIIKTANLSTLEILDYFDTITKEIEDAGEQAKQ